MWSKNKTHNWHNIFPNCFVGILLTAGNKNQHSPPFQQKQKSPFSHVITSRKPEQINTPHRQLSGETAGNTVRTSLNEGWCFLNYSGSEGARWQDATLLLHTYSTIQTSTTFQFMLATWGNILVGFCRLRGCGETGSGFPTLLVMLKNVSFEIFQ